MRHFLQVNIIFMSCCGFLPRFSCYQDLGWNHLTALFPVEFSSGRWTLPWPGVWCLSISSVKSRAFLHPYKIITLDWKKSSTFNKNKHMYKSYCWWAILYLIFYKWMKIIVSNPRCTAYWLSIQSTVALGQQFSTGMPTSKEDGGRIFKIIEKFLNN